MFLYSLMMFWSKNLMHFDTSDSAVNLWHRIRMTVGLNDLKWFFHNLLKMLACLAISINNFFMTIFHYFRVSLICHWKRRSSDSSSKIIAATKYKLMLKTNSSFFNKLLNDRKFKAISPIKWASWKTWFGGIKTLFFSTNQSVDDESCTYTSLGTKCSIYIHQTQDFDRLGGQK